MTRRSTTSTATRQKITVAKAQADAALAQLGGDPDQPIESNPFYLQAKSAVDNAQRDLNDTIVKAPFDGVGHQRQRHPGRLLPAGLAAGVQPRLDDQNVGRGEPEGDRTDLCAPGQSATISVDTYPGVEWKGVVDSISPASGSSFSLLPAQNTTGNWVKVVQRIPMRVRIETPAGKPPLRVGMSVTVDVDTGHARGLPDFCQSLARPRSRRRMADCRLPRRPRRRSPIAALITACVILAVIMQALDTTIANVALPYIQGSVSASADQINWVLTSYIVAAAIMTPPSGFLANRFGRKRVLLTAIAGFVVASILCGVSQSLNQIVAFRLMQGLFGAALVPLSQGFLLDMYDVKERGSAMALFGVSVMVGPVLGPVIGGWLTDNISWRWVFYINVPIGALAFAGISVFVIETKKDALAKLDWLGFAALSVAIGALQIFLDRGEQLDWFSSGEIIFEAVVCRLGLLHLPRPYVHGEAILRQSAPVPRPQFRARLHLHLHRRRHLSRLARADDALSADADGLSRDDGGPRHGAARPRHDGVHVRRRAPDRPRRHALAAGARPGLDAPGRCG